MQERPALAAAGPRTGSEATLAMTARLPVLPTASCRALTPGEVVAGPALAAREGAAGMAWGMCLLYRLPDMKERERRRGDSGVAVTGRMGVQGGAGREGRRQQQIHEM